MAKKIGRPHLTTGDYTIQRCYSVRESLYKKFLSVKGDDITISKIITDAFVTYITDNQ